MPIPIARYGDTWVGICTNHNPVPIPVTGNIGSPSQDFTYDEERLIAIDGTICPSSCGHNGILQASSILTDINGIKIGLLGDHVTGSGINGTVIAASSLTSSD